MFRKLVSNLAFSPALVGQLAFYAKRLKKEEATRRLGLVFTALALVVQSFAVFSPPESANAASNNSFISGGIDSKSDFLKAYDANRNNLKDLFTSLGITRKNISDTTLGEVHSKKDVYSWGLNPHFSKSQGERSYTVKKSGGGTRTFYYRPLHLWDTGNNKKTGSYYKSYIGKSSSGTWFAILKICGNLVLKVHPPKPKCPTGTEGTYPDCKTPPKKCTVPGKEHLPENDPKCKPDPKCTIPGKENLKPDDPKCKLDPVAACSYLKVSPLINNRFQFDTETSASNGATISQYTYVIKRDGKVVDTIKQQSTQTSNSYVYTQTAPGTYTATVTVTTSAGEKTSDQCASTFSVAKPNMCPQKPDLLESDPLCQPCPGDESIWIKDIRCEANVVETKSANNSTQSVDATKATAKASDTIIYTLNIENKGLKAAPYTIEENLEDVLEYAKVVETGGGTLDGKKLIWPSVTLQPGEKQTRMFSVQVMSNIPSMGTGADDRTSYDCRMNNTFGNAVAIDVECPVEKVIVEEIVNELPHTGPAENMIFAGGLLAIVSYFYARSRLMKKEVRLIRRDLNAGTI